MLWVEFSAPTEIQGFTDADEYQVATYSVEIQQGHTYEFIVEGGNRIEGTENSFTVHWGMPGQGKVKLIESSEIGCDADINTLKVTIGSTETGITSEAIQNLSVYPYPIKDYLFIKFNDAISSDITISVVDVFGTSVIERNFDHTDLNAEQTLDFSFLKSGLYLLDIISEKNRMVYKIIKE